MHRHRLAQEADAYRLPVPPEPPLDLSAFALVPVAGASAADYGLLLAIYRAALDEARAAVRPSVLERDDFQAPN